jgi:hypothetical protein
MAAASVNKAYPQLHMANILIFAREILPYCNSVGSSLRVATLARHLADAGHSVTLLGAKGNFVSNFGLDGLLKGVNTIYIDDYLQNYYTKKIKRNLHAAEYPSVNVRRTNVGRNIELIKSFVIKNIIKGIKYLSVPDIAIIFLPKFIFYALKIIRQKNINTLIVSSPPHSSQVLILFAKVFGLKRLELIVDYRDGWNTFDLFRPKYQLGAVLSKCIERKVLLTCDQFLYQSSRVLLDITDQLKLKDIIESKSTLVRNGYTESGDLTILAEQDKKFNSPIFKIGYFGGIDFDPGSWRNPSRFLDKLDAIGKSFELVIHGPPVNLAHAPKYNNISIIHKGMLDLPLAKNAMVSFDALFVFHSSGSGSEEVIPGKFYEYIQACRPILVCGPPLMECGLLVEECNFGVFIRSTSTNNDVRKLIERLQDETKAKEFIFSLKSRSFEFSRRYQYSKIRLKNS